MSVEELEEENRHLRKQLGGYKGSKGYNPVTTGLEGGYNPVTTLPAGTHFARDYERFCTNCEDPNPNYRGEPNVFCNSPSCQGKRIPMGHVERSDLRQREDGKIDAPSIQRCYSCGSDEDALFILEED
jgi:hypothetical protein